RKASREAAGTSAPRITLLPRYLGPWPLLIQVSKKLTTLSGGSQRKSNQFFIDPSSTRGPPRQASPAQVPGSTGPGEDVLEAGVPAGWRRPGWLVPEARSGARLGDAPDVAPCRQDTSGSDSPGLE